MPVAPDYAPSLAAPERRRPPQRATPKNSRRVFFGNPSGRTLAERHSARRTAPGYRACGYKTASGRPKWLSRDPLGEYAGINVYGYVLNDPVNGRDPFGLCFRPVNLALGVAGLAGGVLETIGIAGVGTVTGGWGLLGLGGASVTTAATYAYGLGNVVVAFGGSDADAKLMSEWPQNAAEIIGRVFGGKKGQDIASIFGGIHDTRAAKTVLEATAGYTSTVNATVGASGSAGSSSSKSSGGCN